MEAISKIDSKDMVQHLCASLSLIENKNIKGFKDTFYEVTDIKVNKDSFSTSKSKRPPTVFELDIEKEFILDAIVPNFKPSLMRIILKG